MCVCVCVCVCVYVCVCVCEGVCELRFLSDQYIVKLNLTLMKVGLCMLVCVWERCVRECTCMYVASWGRVCFMCLCSVACVSVLMCSCR